jgi:hypothetical protein
MKIKVIDIIFITIVSLGSMAAIIYNLYMAWFWPAEFLEKASKGVKDWWPFARFFKSYYSSPTWLWLTRIWATIFLLVIIYVGYQLITGQMNILP